MGVNIPFLRHDLLDLNALTHPFIEEEQTHVRIVCTYISCEVTLIRVAKRSFEYGKVIVTLAWFVIRFHN